MLYKILIDGYEVECYGEFIQGDIKEISEASNKFTDK